MHGWKANIVVTNPKLGFEMEEGNLVGLSFYYVSMKIVECFEFKRATTV